MEVGGWVQVSLGKKCIGKSSQNSPISVLLFLNSICILFAHCWKLLVHDFSVLSMPVMGFKQKSFDRGLGRVGGWALSSFILDLILFIFCKSPYLVDVNLGLGRRLHECTVPLARQIGALVFTDDSLVLKVALVAHEDHGNLARKRST